MERIKGSFLHTQKFLSCSLQTENREGKGGKRLIQSGNLLEIA